MQTAARSLKDASNFLEMHGVGMSFRVHSVLFSLSKLGVGLQAEKLLRVLEDPFLDRSIAFATNHVLRVIKHKARIPVKGE